MTANAPLAASQARTGLPCLDAFIPHSESRRHLLLHPHFAGAETGPGKLGAVPNVTRLARGRARGPLARAPPGQRLVWERPLFPPYASSTDAKGSGHGQALLLPMQGADRSCHHQPSVTIPDGTPAFGTGCLTGAQPTHCPLAGTPPDNCQKALHLPGPAAGPGPEAIRA